MAFIHPAGGIFRTHPVGNYCRRFRLPGLDQPDNSRPAGGLGTTMRVNRRDLLGGASGKPVCHISSLVVHCLPDAMSTAISSIEAMPNMEVPESDPNGKFVVLLETEDESTILDDIGKIQELKGVINATLVYHQIDDRIYFLIEVYFYLDQSFHRMILLYH